EEGEEGEAPTGSLGSLTDGSGSANDGDEGTEGEDEESSIIERITAWFEELFSGSADGGSGSGSADEDATDEDGEGNGEGEGEGEGEDTGDTVINSAELDADVLLAVGSLAAAGIAVGIAANGGVNLPPLPGVDVGVVCELPQEGIDFLKGNGSMQPDECLPEN
ncbi:hypothetical protein ACFFVD_04945, partial [Dietzia aerolata]